MAKEIYTKIPSKYVPALAKALKELPEIEAPEWIAYVKTGTSKKRPPVDDNFWYVRAASILRQLYMKGVIGVGKLRTRYGSRKDRGGKPDHFRKASGKVIRLILQQSENAGLVEKVDKMQYGRRLTAKGKEFLDSIKIEEVKGLSLEDSIVEIKNIPQEDIQEIKENSEVISDGE